MGNLGDAVVFDDELLGLEGVDHVALFRLDGGGDEHDIGLGAEGVALVVRWGGGLVAGWGRVLGRDGCDATEGEQDGAEKGPHRFSLAGDG
jgi:hypothetical protein